MTTVDETIETWSAAKTSSSTGSTTQTKSANKTAEQKVADNKTSPAKATQSKSSPSPKRKAPATRKTTSRPKKTATAVVKNEHIADQVQVFPSKRVWPD
ncbi:hypothetical protein [Thiomicrorhabdus chilensis]|uniref:hypothetical protein n=1 Tax=Thiomicrorhabdus chilensis TaxID=63656 RepID=UPI00048FAD3A|nr:hypothetical protein [Thiomicrorhabdus chilensis]